MARLIFRSDAGEDMEFRVAEDSPEVIIGRHKSCGIRTAEHTVSRRHAKISYVQGEYQLVDMGSSNGTFFDQTQISEYWLKDQDDFLCGAFPIRFELDESERAAAALDVPELPIEAIEFGAGDPDGGFDIGGADSGFPGPPGGGWNAFEAEPKVRPSAMDLPPTQLPFEPPNFPGDDSVIEALAEPEIGQPELDEGIILEALVLDVPDVPPAPAAILPEIEPVDESQFGEFNRQLERKDSTIAELRDRCSDQEEQLDLLQTQVDALQATLDEHSAQGVSTAEFTALTSENETLRAHNGTLASEHSELQERLQAFQNQVLKIQDSQPSERELDDLRAAKAERDRLWEDRERLESKLLAFKRQLGGDAEVEDDDSDPSDLVRSMRESLTESKDELLVLRDQARDASERADTADDRVAALENQLEVAEDRVASMENQVEELGSRPEPGQLEEVRGELDTLRSSHDVLKTELEARPKQDEVSVLTSDLERARADVETRSAEQERLASELATAIARVSTLQSERDELNDIARDRSEVTELEQTVAKLRGEMALYIEERDAARKDLSQQTDEGADLNARATALGAENAELKEILSSLPEPDDVRRLEEDRERYLNEATQATAGLKIASDRISELEASVAEATSSGQAGLDRLTDERDSLKKSVADLDSRITELDELLVHSPSKSQLDEMRGRLDDLTRESDALASKVERETARAERAESALSAAQSEVGGAASELGDLRAESDKAKAAAKASDRVLAAARTAADNKDGEIEELRESLKSAEATAAKLAKRAEEASASESRSADLERELAETRERLSSELKAAEAALETAKAEAAAAATSGAQADEVQEQIEDMAEERDDLLAANKAHVKRISSLLKQVDELTSKAKEQSGASKELEDLKAALSAAESAKASVEISLKAAQSQVAELKKSAESALDPKELEQAQARLRIATRERDDLLKANETLKAADDHPAPAARVGGGGADLVLAMSEVLEDINGRVSDFRTNSETVQFCLEDVRDGRDVADNFAAATDMLNTSSEQVDAIKAAIRRFKREHVEKA